MVESPGDEFKKQTGSARSNSNAIGDGMVMKSFTDKLAEYEQEQSTKMTA